MANIITMGTKPDKTGSTVTIKSTNTVMDTPVLAFFMRNFSALIDQGWTHAVAPPVHANTKAVYAEIDGKIVGHIVYNVLDDAFKTAWIVFSCVEDDYRGRGIYNIMHEYFENYAKVSGSKKIASYVHVDNLPRQASCASVGMRPFYFRMEKSL